MYFITKREYKPNFRRMKNQFKVKSAIWAVLFAASLIIMVLTSVEYFGGPNKMRKSRAGAQRTMGFGI